MPAETVSELIGRTNFATTPLGPQERWPQSLRTALSICLSSRFPMLIWWGPELAMLYNDAYATILGNKHPAALGRPGIEAWREIWPVVGPMLERVVTAGESTWSEDQLLVMNRKGFMEETYFTWSYSPIADETGIGGAFTAVFETTERVLSERRLVTLRKLTEEVSRADEIGSTCKATIDALGACPREVPFALLYLLDADGQGAHLAAHSSIDAGMPASPQHVTLAASPWPFAEALERRDLVVVDDLEKRFRALRGGAWPELVQRATVQPIQATGSQQPYGFLVIGASPRLDLDEPYRNFMRLACNHIGSALASAAAYAEERKRAEALAEIDRAKTAFFSNISHEFRTPLTLMLGPLEDAIGKGQLDGEALQIAHRNALRLLKLVNALLDFSRIEAGRAEASYEPTDLAALTRELASAFESAFASAGVGLEIVCPPLAEPVYVDPSLWETIVLNLLSNAFKFTFDGKVTLSLTGKDDSIELEVRDTGIGVAAQEVPRLFERFHRVAGAKSRTHEGSGIGLALVHELVRMHGGTIEATSTLGEGSAFTVRIPRGFAHLPHDRIRAKSTLAPAPRANVFVEEARRWVPQAPSEAPAPASDRARILVVDDNADMREYVGRVLGQRWSVELATDGQAGLELVQARKPDLIISDIMMPGLDGMALLRELRADPKTAAIPVIFLSARAGDEAKSAGIEAGADDYLVKPFSARELVARVNMHLELAGLRANAAVLLEREREARATAEAASRAKDEFLAILGHELRNPLAPIQTALQLMALRNDPASKERQVIQRQVDHVVRLVDDLLDVSRITRGKLELTKQRIEIALVIAQAIEMASPLIEQKQHRLHVQVSPTGNEVDVDPGRMAQVLSNLLTNAAKYTPSGGDIAIVAARDEDDIVIRVRDTGIGIAEDDIGKMFEPFVQDPQSLDRSRGGLGLGLAIVRNLVERHGGSVDATSGGRGKGSEFFVRLPAAHAPHASEVIHAAARPSPAQGSGRTILVVDDNVDAAMMVVDTLQMLGHAARAVHDGPSALGVASGMKPDMALLDIGLPVMDGYELARRFREIPELRGIRLIALTGYGQDSDRARSLEAGFDDHLVKPLRLELLEQILGSRN